MLQFRMRIGYARVSTREQNLDRQIDALKAAGCERVYLDKISTRKDFVARPEWNRMWEALRTGDALVVHELDRMGRDLRDLLGIITTLEDKGIELHILQGMFSGVASLKGATPEQLLSRHILLVTAAAFAEYERNVNLSRTLDGLAAARKRGVKGGRKFALSAEDAALCVALYRDPNVSVASIARRFGISTDTVRLYAKRADRAEIEKTEKADISVRAGAISEAASIPRNDHIGREPQSAPQSPAADSAPSREGDGHPGGRAEAV